MGLFRRIAGILGFGRDEVNKDDEDRRQHRGGGEERGGEEEGDEPPNSAGRSRSYQETGLPRRGFSVPVKVAVERPSAGPVLVPCDSGDGGVQGLRWCAKRLRIDEDGDVAHEFLDEVLLEALEPEEKPQLKFAPRHGTRPAMVKNQVISHDGKVQHCVEHHGRLEWV
ncbi:uncharacterized protein LOC115743076 [Rhodamnia argentea]|uniref:Uncharacterized protein LOC115743076 n=1 Tax=Rhodamnia argentea TaxID=178133 RepID=A0A8B8PHC7_9MYRT|nr:uncharacterized protein LOC115743076 [Rhodamnia argentea]